MSDMFLFLFGKWLIVGLGVSWLTFLAVYYVKVISKMEEE